MRNQEAAWRIGQEIRITAGPFIGYQGVISLIDLKKQTVRVKINFMTKTTPVEVPVSSIQSTHHEM